MSERDIDSEDVTAVTAASIAPALAAADQAKEPGIIFDATEICFGRPHA